MPDIERVSIEGRSYIICAECRHPTRQGMSWSPLYWVPQPDQPSQRSAVDKQAICTGCYQDQWRRIYPETEPPALPDGRLSGYGAVARGVRSIADHPSEIDLWTQALERARASGGAETVPQAYAFLSGRGLEVEQGVTP